MRLRPLMLAFCFLLPAASLQAQEEARALTDEQDVRVATVAAREAAATQLLAEGNQARDAGDAARAASALNRAGRFLLKLNKQSEAIATYRNALEILKNTSEHRTRIDTLNGLAGAYERSSQCTQTIPLLQQTISLSDKYNYPAGKADALLIQPLCMSNKLTALQSAQESLELWKSINVKLGMAQAYLVVGKYQMIQNNLIEATEAYEAAKQLWQELNVPNKKAEALIELGFIEWRKGAWQASLPFYIEAQQLIVEETADPYLMGQIKAGLAEAFIESGLPQAGLEKYREAHEFYRQTNYPVHMIGIEWGIGTAHYFLRNYSEAIANLKNARNGAIETKNLMIAALCDDFLGRTYYELNDNDTALQHYQAALQGFTRSSNPMEAARTMALMGQVYQRQGNFTNARKHYLKALASFRKLSNQVNESATLYALGTLELQQDSVDAAEKYLEESIRITETMRQVSRNVDLTAAFSAKVHERYEKYVDCKMRKYHASQSQSQMTDAFQTSELARARSLTELLHATQANLFPGLDPQLALQERELRGYLQANENAKLALLSGKYKTAELTALEEKRRELELKHAQLIQQIRTRNPSYEQVIQPTAWNLAKIQEQVVADDQTVLLEYSLGSEKSYLWAITRSQIYSYELPDAQRITEVAERVYNLLKALPSNNTDAEISAAVQALAQMVLFPAKEQLTHRRIIVVPDGVLNYIPFQILPSPADNDPLVASKEIINAPSASILGELKQQAARRQPAANVLAAFGDPVFASEVTASKDTKEDIATARWHSNLRHLELSGSRFDPAAVAPLFYAKHELRSLRDIAGEGALIVSDYAATREQFLNTDLTNFSILHLVTHGYFNPATPESSGFVLSTTDRQAKNLKGFVELRDIYELRVPVLLVVLSACQTALGKDIRGEGLLGLTHSFMYAGASSVVASLWNVEDGATAELMKLFYSNMLRDGMKPSEALRAAQNSIRQRPEWRSPYYWAGFTLQGDPQIIRPKTEVRSEAFVFKTGVVVGLLLLLGLGWWFLRRRFVKS
ncbi:MAG TPA: CHAT domain-containing protein [Pyrinomonadaceae bacterium]